MYYHIKYLFLFFFNKYWLINYGPVSQAGLGLSPD